MKNLSGLLLLALALPAGAQNFVAGQFDSYTFTESWEPTFCEGKPSATECRTESAGRFDATHLALHGLWPDVNGDSSHAYGYCGIDSQTQSLDKASTWCQLPEPASDATVSALKTVMPGVASCLDHHEWARHGSCAGMNADDYFALAASLVNQMAASSFGQFLAANAGQKVSMDDALTAFEKDFGDRSLVSLNCTNVRGSSALLEVRVHLPASLASGANLTSSLIATGDHGNCPSLFLLDPVSSR
jgi:ribonuclease T2